MVMIYQISIRGIAVSPSSNEIHIFHWEQGQWKLTHLLKEHDLPVTGLDWAPNTNRIVSCSQVRQLRSYDQFHLIFCFSLIFSSAVQSSNKSINI